MVQGGSACLPGPTFAARLLAAEAGSFRPPRRRGILPGMNTRPRSQAGPPMTLGNMRATGVRSFAVSYWQCHHEGVLSATVVRALRRPVGA
jgi:hypothetical protein